MIPTDLLRTHLELAPEQETQFLVGEIRNAQAQSAALIAAIVALLASPGNEHVFVFPLPLQRILEVVGGIVYVTIGFYLLNGLRIAGIKLQYGGETSDGVSVSLTRLRMLTRRMYLTRTALGYALFFTVPFLALAHLTWASTPGVTPASRSASLSLMDAPRACSLPRAAC